MAVDWSKRGDYIAKHGLTPEQADEALNDANAVIFDPDYNTKSGRQVRTLGYSPSAQAVLVSSPWTKGMSYGASTPGSPTAVTAATTAKEFQMSKNLDDLLAEIGDEAEAAEADQTDRPIPPHVKITRGNPRSKVLQVRLNPEELESLEHIARRRELPVSTIAREQLLRLIAEDHLGSPRALAQLRDRLAGAADTILQVADTIAGAPSG
jgi:uncharacterized DUF497 family protein